MVHTIALAYDHLELTRAKELGIVCKTYPEALGEITKDKKTIAISGTHGKTTTTAMMYYALKACGINPTVIIGSLLTGVGTNFIPGDSEYMVVEACEYKRSFLNLHPLHVLVTNIDADHLDYYKDMEDIQDAFQSFADSVSKDGYLVTHNNISLRTGGTMVDADTVPLEGIELSVLGKHNQANAALVIAFTQKLGLDEEKVRHGLKEFKGTWRRLEYKGSTTQGVLVYDDYAHHPTELRATLDALRDKYPKGEYSLYVFFQPHLYSRTKMFLEDFATVLLTVDHAYILPIYAARELDDGTVTSSMLIESINTQGGSAEAISGTAEISQKIESINEPRAIAINIGAGDAYAELNKIQFV